MINDTQDNSVQYPWFTWYKKLSFNKKMAIIFLLCAFFVCMGVVLYRTSSISLQNTHQESQSAQYISQPESSSTGLVVYQSNTENIRFSISETWEVVTSTVSLPIGFENQKFALYNKENGCVVSIAKMMSDVYDTRKQVSFGDRVFSSYSQFDSNWFVPLTSTTSQLVFSPDKRKYLSGEFRVSSGLGSRSSVLLFMSNGYFVPDTCNIDFNTMLSTVEPYFEKTAVNSSSEGVIIFDRVWDDVTTDKVLNKSYDHLVFIDKDSEERREVAKIPSGTWGQKFFISNNTLYFPSNVYDLKNGVTQFSSSLYVADLFTNRVMEITGTTKSDSYISSVYVQDGTIYYLLGSSEFPTCLDTYSACPVDLYAVPVSGGSPTLIGRSSFGGAILGYVEDEDTFYIEQRNGDAGCMRTYMSKIVGGKEEMVGEDSGCFNFETGDFVPDDIEINKTISAIKQMLQDSRVCAQGVRVQDGFLYPLEGEFATYESFCFTR